LKARVFSCQHQNRPDFGRKSIKNGKIPSGKYRARQSKRKTLYGASSLMFKRNPCMHRDAQRGREAIGNLDKKTINQLFDSQSISYNF
jgi:hypothetical protein